MPGPRGPFIRVPFFLVGARGLEPPRAFKPTSPSSWRGCQLRHAPKFCYDPWVPRLTYGFDIAASVGGPLIDVKFSDGREASGWLKDKKFVGQMVKADQQLLALYSEVIQALGSAYNVFARRRLGEAQGTAFLVVTYQREGVQRKRWIAAAKDDVGLLLDALREARFAPISDGDPSKDDYVQILVPFESLDRALLAHSLISDVVRQSPKYWGW